MAQEFVKNEKYLIKTPYGWESFEGVVKTIEDKDMLVITTCEGSSIKLTPEHKLLINEKPVPANSLCIGDTIETTHGDETIDHIENDTNTTVYDIFNSETHTILANNVKSMQCDELAFANNKIAREMWASVFPTLSCLAKGTYVLGDFGYMKIERYFSGTEQPGEYFKILNQSLYTHACKKEPLSHGYVSPASETIIITTRTGYRVEVTPNHPLLTQDGMVPSKDLHIGSLVRCDIGMGLFGQAKYQGQEVPYDDDYPEYVMMYRRESVISFLKNELFEDRPYGCVYQQKLLLANLGIVSRIYGQCLYVLSTQYSTFMDIFGFPPSKTVVQHDMDIGDNYFYDDIVEIEYGYQDVTYDFTVPESHSFLQNGIMGSNTGGRCIVTSTPSDDETLFAELWNNAVKTIDEHGNELEVGINGFKALKVKWDEHPERDESYKRLQIAQFGVEKFRREHELEFISMEETLVDPVYLSTYEGIEPISKTGQIRWYKPLDKEKIYVIGYDPSLGTGRDNSAIVIFEFPTMIQVGEWIHNRSDVPTQIKILKRILDMFKDAGFDEDNVYWSLENNSIGEAPLVMIKHEIGDDEFFGNFMKEKKKRNKGRTRGGFFTDHTEKMKACNRFKIWFEQGKMTVNSKALVAELKGFVAQGRTYKARAGDTDDIVMASMLVVRMVEILMQDEEEYLEELGVTANNLFDDEDEDGDDEDGWGAPMPIL